MCTFSAYACGERTTFRTLRNVVEKRMLLLILNIMSRFECVDFKRQKKKKKRSFTYLGIPSIARSTPAMMRERKRQRALLRLRLRDVAARDDAEFFCCFCLFFCKIGGGGGLLRFFFNKRVESSLSVDSKKHDERRRVMCYDVRFINVLLLCKKVSFSFALSLFCLFRLSR